MTLTCERLLEFDLFEFHEKDMNFETFSRFYSVLSEIEKIDYFIRKTPSFPGSTDKIVRDELISVIGSTLSIEGTILDKEEILESIDKADKGEPLKRRGQEAANSKDVYDFLRNTRIDEYTESLIRQIHTLFTKEMNYTSNIPGQYRLAFNVTFGEPRRQCLCPTLSEIECAMAGFIKWLNKIGTGPISSSPFVKAIMAHYYLSEIHPFGDGNGRTARALEAAILYKHGVNRYCFWSLANFWAMHKDIYINHLGDIRRTQNPFEFVIWGLNGYKDEITTIQGRVLTKHKQLMLRDYVQFLFRTKDEQKIKINQRMVELMRIITARARISIKKLWLDPEAILLYKDVSRQTKTRDLVKLLDLELLKPEKTEQGLILKPNYELLEELEYYVRLDPDEISRTT